MKIKLGFLYVDSCFDVPSLNLLRKVVVENAGCVLPYFCGGHKNNLRL